MSRLHGQDVILAVRLLDYAPQWTFQSLGESIGLSASQCHAAFGRLASVGLVDPRHRMSIKSNLLEFLGHGVKYLFPVEPGELVTGIPTAHSAPIWIDRFVGSPGTGFVWEHPGGSEQGSKVAPIHKSVPELSLTDGAFYSIMAVIDSIRLGKPREKNEALLLLEDLILGRL